MMERNCIPFVMVNYFVANVIFINKKWRLQTYVFAILLQQVS